MFSWRRREQCVQFSNLPPESAGVYVVRSGKSLFISTGHAFFCEYFGKVASYLSFPRACDPDLSIPIFEPYGVSVSVSVVPHPQAREEACLSQQLVGDHLDQEHGSPARMRRKSFLQSDIDTMLSMRREEPLFRIRNRWRTVPGVRLMRRAVFRTANSERSPCRNKD